MTAAHNVRAARFLAKLDARDDKEAVLAMREASRLLQSHGLSFRALVELTEARRLLLPSRIATAIMMMDSTTAKESESAFAAARKMMQGCGLTFLRLIEALEHQPVDEAEVEKLRLELQLQTDNARRLQRQVMALQTASGISRGVSNMSWFSGSRSAVIANGLAVVVGAFALWWLALWFKTEGPLRAAQASTVVQPAVTQPILPPPVRQAQSVPLGPPVRMNMPVRREPSGSGYYAGPGYDVSCYWQRQRFWDGYGWRVRNVQVCGEDR
jgi:hypothetical protein